MYECDTCGIAYDEDELDPALLATGHTRCKYCTEENDAGAPAADDAAEVGQVQGGHDQRASGSGHGADGDHTEGRVGQASADGPTDPEAGGGEPAGGADDDPRAAREGVGRETGGQVDADDLRFLTEISPQEPSFKTTLKRLASIETIKTALELVTDDDDEPLPGHRTRVAKLRSRLLEKPKAATKRKRVVHLSARIGGGSHCDYSLTTGEFTTDESAATCKRCLSMVDSWRATPIPISRPGGSSQATMDDDFFGDNEDAGDLSKQGRADHTQAMNEEKETAAERRTRETADHFEMTQELEAFLVKTVDEARGPINRKGLIGRALQSCDVAKREGEEMVNAAIGDLLHEGELIHDSGHLYTPGSHVEHQQRVEAAAKADPHHTVKVENPPVETNVGSDAVDDFTSSRLGYETAIDHGGCWLGPSGTSYHGLDEDRNPPEEGAVWVTPDEFHDPFGGRELEDDDDMFSSMADYVLREIDRCTMEKERVQAQVKRIMNPIEYRMAYLLNRYGMFLRSHAKLRLSGVTKQSLDFPHGRLSFRKSTKHVVTNQADCLEWCAEHAPDAIETIPASCEIRHSRLTKKQKEQCRGLQAVPGETFKLNDTKLEL